MIDNLHATRACIKFINLLKNIQTLFFWSGQNHDDSHVRSLISSRLPFPPIHQTSVFPFRLRESVATDCREPRVSCHYISAFPETSGFRCRQFNFILRKTSFHAWLELSLAPYNVRKSFAINPPLRPRISVVSHKYTDVHIERFRLFRNILRQ